MASVCKLCAADGFDEVFETVEDYEKHIAAEHPPESASGGSAGGERTAPGSLAAPPVDRLDEIEEVLTGKCEQLEMGMRSLEQRFIAQDYNMRELRKQLDDQAVTLRELIDLVKLNPTSSGKDIPDATT
jgi:hypothetical protein